jgi:hypothetical protein
MVLLRPRTKRLRERYQRAAGRTTVARLSRRSFVRDVKTAVFPGPFVAAHRIQAYRWSPPFYGAAGDGAKVSVAQQDRSITERRPGNRKGPFDQLWHNGCLGEKITSDAK